MRCPICRALSHSRLAFRCPSLLPRHRSLLAYPSFLHSFTLQCILTVLTVLTLQIPRGRLLPFPTAHPHSDREPKRTNAATSPPARSFPPLTRVQYGRMTDIGAPAKARRRRRKAPTPSSPPASTPPSPHFPHFCPHAAGCTSGYRAHSLRWQYPSVDVPDLLLLGRLSRNPSSRPSSRLCFLGIINVSLWVPGLPHAPLRTLCPAHNSRSLGRSLRKSHSKPQTRLCSTLAGVCCQCEGDRCPCGPARSETCCCASNVHTSASVVVAFPAAHDL
ncbi:hypothetical protein PYCCODRAFT_294755 [Trametes coccinea BRFM310]|uniref:Uncharacterized protein n=1 Tax=Trametes coccinea (strain BRFM310) TaxID=1353009 RepID=A0A1Y2IQZ3_TRAC3|nr:hypothetical protein PYCCODRAFT_294755 [Trametes coccinea BRFM310]